jgi:hypothetical protein
MLIYRLANAENCGPWQSADAPLLSNDNEIMHQIRTYVWHDPNLSDHDIPECDCHDDSHDYVHTLMKNHGYICGCASLEQFLHWFGDIWRNLAGYYVTLYEVDEGDLFTCYNQVIFDPDAATPVRTYTDPLDLI